ncbi:integrase, catalytic region, zinc finger, CCHC-type containing protein [Tanacetum coccineum]
MEAEVEQNAVDKQCADIKRKNLLIQNENLIANWLSNELLYMVMNDVNIVSCFSELHDAYTVEQARCLELEAELSKLKHKIQKDDHSEMIKHFSNLEIDHINLQLKYQHLKECFGNNKSQPSQDSPEFDTVFEINKMKASLQGKDNTIRKLKEQISQMNERRITALQEQNELFRAENEKVKQHYKELYDTIKITRAKTIEKMTSLLTENEKLKAQLKGKMQCVTMPVVKSKVLAPGMYAIDVEPIPPRNRNNREVHLDYLKHLKESVETLREIVEEARIEKPLDNVLGNACFYTKRSQELLEYVIGTCPKEFNKRDKKDATTPLNRKQQVIFKEPLNSFAEASRSKPMSNTKNNRILPTKSDNKKKVEAHPRNNKSKLKQKNCVDSSISSTRTIINSNSNSVCKTCNKCLIFANHDKFVVKYLKSVNAPTVKNVSSTVKQVWKATGKLFSNVGYQWKPTGRKFTLREQRPLTIFTKPKVVPLKQSEHVSSSKIVITERFNNTSQKLLNRYKRKEKAVSNGIPTTAKTHSIDDSVQYTTVSANQQDHNRNWGCSKHMTGNRSRLKNFMKKFIGTVRFGNDHFGAIMGYGDYVIGDSVISKVYYVEGLGHNLLSVGQFCDYNLEVAFRKHSCYVRDVDGVELLKGSHGSNLYTISVEDMMKSSPISLLTLQQNGFIERRNQTLVEAARTMLIFSNAPMKHDLKFLRVFGALCYPTNDSKDLGKLKATTNIGIFVGYALNRKGYRIYNKRTRRIMETIHVQFNELTEQMDPVHTSTGPKPILLTPGQISSGLLSDPVPAGPYVPPTNKDLEILFQPKFDEYLEPSNVERPVPPAPAV